MKERSRLRLIQASLESPLKCTPAKRPTTASGRALARARACQLPAQRARFFSWQSPQAEEPAKLEGLGSEPSGAVRSGAGAGARLARTRGLAARRACRSVTPVPTAARIASPIARRSGARGVGPGADMTPYGTASARADGP